MNQNRMHTLEVLLGILGTLLIALALGLYILHEPARLEQAQSDILSAQLDDAMTLYAENCAVCHGLNGEGIGATPPLDNPGLRSMSFDDLYKVIARGRFDTAMPAWSKDDGGPLSDYQIEELVALVQSGDWQETGDRVVNLGLAPLIPFTAEPDPALVAAVASLPDGATLQAAIGIYAAQCVACHGADGLGSGIAPPLNDPAVREKSAEELLRTITYGSPGTLMAGWSNALSSEDISAMVALIQRWDELPSGLIPAPDVPVPTTEESIALGAELYSANCARCHGPEGQGKPIAPSINVKSFLTNTSDQALQQIIALGVPGTAMPAWGDRMTAAEIQAIVGFIRQWEETAPEVAQPLGPRSGQGGPPWLRNQNNVTPDATAPQVTPVPGAGTGGQAGSQMSQQDMTTHMAQEAANSGSGQGQGQGQHAGRQGQTQASASEALDWRALALIAGGAAFALALILFGFKSLANAQGKPPAS